MSVDQFLLSADTTDLNYPEIRPTLDLNFARVKALDPRITFTRSSGGSYVGADGLIKYAGVNEARFDHDPETGESLGLLVEEARTNLFLRSEEFDNSYWTQNAASVVSNIIVAPDGTLTGDKLVEDTSRTTHGVNRVAWAESEGNHTSSFFVKKGERTFAYIETFSTNVRRTVFDLVSGEVTDQPSEHIGASIDPLGNDWFRISITINLTANCRWRCGPSSGSTNSSTIYTGDGTSGIYIWGAQLEQGAFPTSYIPTQASTRTRAADNASITGKNFSEWYRQDEGSIALKIKHNSSSSSNPELIRIDNSTIPDFYRLLFRYSNNRYWLLQQYLINFQPIGNSALSLFFPVNSFPPNTVKTVIGSWRDKDFIAIYDTSNILTNTTSEVLRLHNRLSFGGVNGNITISRLTYFPKRLPNAQLQALTR
jgi:hypothetical protein